MHLGTFLLAAALLFALVAIPPWLYLEYQRRVRKIYPPRGSESRAEATRLLAQGRRGLAVRCLRSAERLSLADAKAALDGRGPKADAASTPWLVFLLVCSCCSVWSGFYLASHASDGSFFANLIGASFVMGGLASLSEEIPRLRRKLRRA